MENDERSGNSLFIFIAALMGIAIGVGLGLFYTWEVDPVVGRNVQPWQLSDSAREDYVIAVALSYSYNHDLDQALTRLQDLRPSEDVGSMVADIACERYKRAEVKTNSDVIAMRAMENLYRAFNGHGCADNQYPTPVPVSFISPTPTLTLTPTLTPPATKTPTPEFITDVPIEVDSPTPPVVGTYIVARQEAFCNPDWSGMIEIRVFDRRGEGIPGIPVQVVWDGNGRETFFTGLKPGREPGYADFQMSAEHTYSVTIPSLTEAPRPILPEACEATVDGETVSALTSYRINFQEQSN
jgi:hypothetical protein